MDLFCSEYPDPIAKVQFILSSARTMAKVVDAGSLRVNSTLFDGEGRDCGLVHILRWLRVRHNCPLLAEEDSVRTNNLYSSISLHGFQNFMVQI